ncbi:P-loop containing nucleoside triphosphate hydrolase protein [Punctularia strigosozonata HHB-11173 SS5]|uniref:P-loop containing nucleoside triphosphate hydrolase protein n=1 Tax=Punctularia strigosozonata (strain HHB-11173) TaxID=741275 RepID=UPI0004417815|nr:P-loop containing nucleoside triphosphate hydrolase protein [Punctularia strigosozonata HHB-11173 SS5]EIN14636.1 P-loop containing nucleoside triphosphate hydrolase protein [Punctularia strigosozonata HHB-11173 SS5]
MRRPQGLAVDVRAPSHTAGDIELTQSPTSSITEYDSKSQIDFTPVSDSTLHIVEQSSAPQYVPPNPSISLLFSLLPRRDLLLLVLPAVSFSMIAGGIAPFMTLTIGQSFDAFASFPLTPNPPESAKHKLLHGVGLAALQLVGLGVGALALTSITSCLWVWTGERNVMALRKRVYAAIVRKDMVWFDTKMGAEGTVQSLDGESEGALGAGGLMAKFTRETDDVRQASSLAAGYLIQYLTTTVTCLVLAFVRSWALTLVILSAVPLLMLIQGISQGVVGPLLAHERAQTATAASLVDRAVAAIATVKAFNAQPHEHAALSTVLDRIALAARKCDAVWSVTSGASQFVSMAMFVQAFWFGAKLVRDGTVSPGDVMAVFWACLIASSNLQMCIPQFVTVAKGKFAMVSLVTLVEDAGDAAPSSQGISASTVQLSDKKTKGARRHEKHLRKITPAACAGEMNIANVTFAYPSRPTQPVLSDLSLYFPAGETTFIVGGSGSGKSTIAQLLSRVYMPVQGTISIDDQDVTFLDDAWTRAHVAAVSQASIVFDMTVHENVALGLAGPGSTRRPEDATRQEVIEACRVALLHDFVRDLPEGYDTKLGNGGANLSGGQKQRLAIARAHLRNPTVLILDEATSALDATSRILVFEAIKAWRRNRTTIVITHDLSQITEDDFVYVLKEGRLIEQGYRLDLEHLRGEFSALLASQCATGGFVPSRTPEEREAQINEEARAALSELNKENGGEAVPVQHSVLPQRPITMGNWMFDVVADLIGSRAPTPAAASLVPAEDLAPSARTLRRRPSSMTIATPTVPSPAHTTPRLTRRYSLQFSPTSSYFPALSHANSSFIEEADDFEVAKSALERSAASASRRRLDTMPSIASMRSERRVRTHWDEKQLAELAEVTVDAKSDEDKEREREAAIVAEQRAQLGLWALLRHVYATVPYKPAVFLGLCVCVVSGAMTPVFSFLLSKLMVQVSIGAHDVRLINVYGAIVLAVAALDGLAMGLKFMIMETTAMCWVTRIRKTSYALVLAQDKKWFDRSENGPASLVQTLVKDGEDARNLISTAIGQFFVVTAMLGVGLVWALVQGWQLTLVGLAIAPVFAGCMALQARLVGNCELRNKRAREDVAKVYYDSISNIRGIRAMAFESVFERQFDTAASRAMTVGVRGAFVEGCSFGVASSLIYLAEALLFYVGALLIANGTYTYLRMVETLNLVVFTVSIGGQLMAFTNKIPKSIQATRDFDRLLQLSSDTDEAHGTLRPPIMGTVTFKNVSFEYPERPDVPVIRDLNLQLKDSECVAIVGASGSGKSTLAALLQRLYEPGTGSISIGPNKLVETDVTFLREHVSVVSQNPNLFDATIAENIAYGNKSLSTIDIRRAAKAANVHEFIMTLPKGYETMVGENAALISGGQAQRIAIARALARPAKILILDECTSALDPENQRIVIDTIRKARKGRTTLMVTHKLPVMMMCHRIVVVQDGRVIEEGTYDSLMQRHGVFAQLASGGEWDA